MNVFYCFFKFEKFSILFRGPTLVGLSEHPIGTDGIPYYK